MFYQTLQIWLKWSIIDQVHTKEISGLPLDVSFLLDSADMIEMINYWPSNLWEISGLRLSFFCLPRLKSVSSLNEFSWASSGMGAAMISECVRKRTASRTDLMINIWRGEYGLKVENVESWNFETLKTSLMILLLSMSFYTCDWSDLDPLFRLIWLRLSYPGLRTCPSHLPLRLEPEVTGHRSCFIRVLAVTY